MSDMKIKQFIDHIYRNIQKDRSKDSRSHWVSNIDYNPETMVITYTQFWKEKNIQLALHETSKRFRNEAMSKL